MINIPKLLRHSIERQKSRPNSDGRQLIYEKTRLAIKSKLNEMNAPDIVQHSYMLSLEAAICEVEASYLLRPEYFVLEENGVPCHFAYQAYLPDYFGTKREVAVDHGRLRQLASSQNMFRYWSFKNDEPSMTDVIGLFNFKDRKAAANGAQGLTDNPHLIDFAARRASRQSDSNQSAALNNNDLSRERNLYAEDDNEIEAFIEGRERKVTPSLGRQANLQSVNARNNALFSDTGAQQISQGELPQNMPWQQNFQKENRPYYSLSGSITNGFRQSSFNTGNAPTANRQAAIQGGQFFPLNGERGNRPSVNNINRFPQAGFQAGRDRHRQSIGNGEAPMNAARSFLPDGAFSKRQPERPWENAARSQSYQATSGVKKNDGKRAPSGQQSQQAGYGNLGGYAATPDICFLDETVAVEQFSVSNQPDPAEGRKISVDEQMKELERRLFKRETVVTASPLPRPIISAPSGRGLSNTAASATGMNGRSPEQKIFVAPLKNDAKNVFSNGVGSNTDRNRTTYPQTVFDNGNLFTLNEIEFASKIPDEETRQSFPENNRDELENVPPIPDFIVKYDKRDAELFEQQTNNTATSDENSNLKALSETRSQSIALGQTRSKQFEQDLFPKDLSFDARRQKRFWRQPTYKALSHAIRENIRGKGSFAAGILAACVLSSGVYYFWRGNVPVFSSVNIGGDSRTFDLSATSAINPSASDNQAAQALSLADANHDGANPEAGKTLSKASGSDMSSRPLEKTRKDVDLPSAAVNPNGVQSPYQQAMLEPPKTKGVNGVNPQDAQIRTRKRADASMLMKDRNGIERKLEGSVAWTLRPPHSAENPYDETALVADFTTTDGQMGVRMSIRKNYRENLDATHLIDLSFTQFEGVDSSSVVGVRGIYFGDKTNILNNQASTTVANLFENNFIASLRFVPDDKDYNENFLGHAAVFGFPATFNDGRTALFVLNKGPQNQELFDKFNEKNTH